MALINLQQISKQYDVKIILKNIDFTLQKNQRIAIIGKNGQGKSTLMKIIAGQIEPDNGKIAIDKKLKIEMLDQQPKFTNGIDVRDAIESQLAELKKAKNQYDEVVKQLENNWNDKALLQLSSSLTAEPLTPVFNTGEVNVAAVNVLLVKVCVPVNVVTVESIEAVTVLPEPTVSIPVPPAMSNVSESRSMLNAPPESP
jgi:ATPase subunit of ABC transporter with duplicated ATPase domains